jgi:hypothetical protein
MKRLQVHLAVDDLADSINTIPVFGGPEKTAPAEEASCTPLAKIEFKADAPCCAAPTSPNRDSTCC